MTARSGLTQKTHRRPSQTTSRSEENPKKRQGPAARKSGQGHAARSARWEHWVMTGRKIQGSEKEQRRQGSEHQRRKRQGRKRQGTKRQGRKRQGRKRQGRTCRTRNERQNPSLLCVLFTVLNDLRPVYYVLRKTSYPYDLRFVEPINNILFCTFCGAHNIRFANHTNHHFFNNVN